MRETVLCKDTSIAAEMLRRGQLVAFPTETVYGLGVDTHCVPALQAAYAMKRRPSDNPMIAHVTGAEMASALVTTWDKGCAALTEAFWPGPLALVLPRNATVPREAAGGRETLALRAPDHPVAQALLDAFGGAISAPSANRSGHVSPTSAAHVMDEFPEADDLLVLDGGASTIGIESTVLDLTITTPRILRPGAVTAEMLGAIIPDVESPVITAQADSPGTTMRHYAPHTQTIMLAPEAIAEHAASTGHTCAVLALSADVAAPHMNLPMPRDAAAYAHRLYATLREADAAPVETIIVEAPPDTPEWRAVHDRLGRATGR